MVRLTLLEIFAGIFYAVVWHWAFGDSGWSTAFLFLSIGIIVLVASLFVNPVSDQHVAGEYWEDY